MFTFAKATDVGDTLAAAGTAGAVAVPLTGTLVGEPAALLVMTTLAVFEPTVVGANFTSTVQELPGATVAQLVVVVNEAASVPVTVTPDTTRLAFPVLLTVIA